MARIGNGSSHVIVATSTIAHAANFAIHFWYRNASVPGGAVIDQPFGWGVTGQNRMLFSWDHTSAPFQQAWAVTDGAFAALKYTTSLLADTWYGLGLTRDGTTCKIYLSGDVDTPTSTKDPSDAIARKPSFLDDGEGAAGSNDDGTVAELGIWKFSDSDTLTAGEMKSLGSGVSPNRVRRDKLVLYWPVYGVASPEPDYAGGGNNGVLTGPPVIADHAPVAPPFGFDLGWQGAFTAPVGADMSWAVYPQGIERMVVARPY